jgi:hypothetical protein
MPAYKRLSLQEFQTESDSSIIGELAQANAAARFPIPPEQIDAWRVQAQPLRAAASHIAQLWPDALNWELLLEYPIPRLGKRIDAVLLAHNFVIVIEFKTGDAPAAGVQQVEEYALLLSYFHQPSHNRQIVPVVIRSDGPTRTVGSRTGTVAPTEVASFITFHTCLERICRMFLAPHEQAINPDLWDAGKFKPIPPIIDAAVALYSEMNVFEIGHACAANETLEQTTAAIVAAVSDAQQNRRKSICFVTGVPGAGKTLVGLNAVHHPALRAEAAFLSGNGPLVKVLREALIRDVIDRKKASGERVYRTRVAVEVQTFVHNVHRFAEEYFDNDTTPTQHVLVFDEAQRAWDAAENLNRYGRNISEPEMMLALMSRHQDWAALIALVGGGQEIHTGEAGLGEWGRALASHPEWKVWASPEVIAGGRAVAGFKLFEGVSGPDVHQEPRLHLSVSLRAIRSELMSDWVNAVIEGRQSEAAEISAKLDPKPTVTRSIDTAKSWLRTNCRGLARAGLVASANAARLRADGLEPSYDFHRFYDWENWFLDDERDARSSSRLEVFATQFEIQGLELDWVGVCWSEDLSWSGSRWVSYRFNNKRWSERPEDEKHKFRVNAYRVLLTRARRGMIIYVPQPVPNDSLRLPDALNRTAQYLIACGAEEYPHADAASKVMDDHANTV